MRIRPLVACAAALLAVGLLGACGTGEAERGSGPEEDAPQTADGLLIDPDTWIPIDDYPLPAAAAGNEAGETGQTAGPAGEGADGGTTGHDQPVMTCESLAATWNQTNQALSGMTFTHPRALVNDFFRAGSAMATDAPPPAIAAAWEGFRDYLQRVNAGFEEVNRDDLLAVTEALEAAVTAADTADAAQQAALISQFIADGCPP
ncbi:MAG: hypothetical protein FWG11_01920 [Promicromonosporaceae bacterium]|nr:hypothetical protein [Promicromonosporaceae bacterium]